MLMGGGNIQALPDTKPSCCMAEPTAVVLPDLPWLKRYSLTDLASNNSKTCCFPHCQRLKLFYMTALSDWCLCSL